MSQTTLLKPIRTMLVSAIYRQIELFDIARQIQYTYIVVKYKMLSFLLLSKANVYSSSC